MNYLSEFIEAYGRELGYQKYQEYRTIFSLSRNKYLDPLMPHFFKPNKNDLSDLRESTVIPFLCEHELKPEYYFANLIH